MIPSLSPIYGYLKIIVWQYEKYKKGELPSMFMGFYMYKKKENTTKTFNPYIHPLLKTS